MAVLNMIAANNWERPIYIDHSLLFTNNIFFTDYLQCEGLAYRFVPIKTPKSGINVGRIDTDILYDHVMNKFVWGNINSPDIYIDEYNKKELNIIQIRYIFARLARALIEENKKDKALQVADKMFELFPNERIPLTYDSSPMVEVYYMMNEFEKANNLVRTLCDNSFALLEYYLSLPSNFVNAIDEDQNREMALLQNMLLMTQKYKQVELNKEIDDRLQNIILNLQNQLGS